MNDCIKGDGVAVGLTDNPSAMLRSIVAGPEVQRTKVIDDTITRSKLMVFGTSTVRGASKNKQKLVSLKQDMELFSKLYIACQTRDGYLPGVLST